MRHLTSCLLLSVLPGLAQFTQLATDHSGSRVWFSTELPARGSGQPSYSRIWVADAQGRRSVAVERPVTDLYRVLRRPQVSSDGSVLVYDANYYCHPGTTCRVPHSLYGLVTPGEMRIEGRVHLSRNGRWLLREQYLYFGPSSQIEIIDRQTGTRRQIAVSRSAYMEGGPRVTASGAVLLYSDGLWLIRPDGTFTYLASYGLNADPEPSPWFITRPPRVSVDDAGSIVAFESVADWRLGIAVVRPGDETPQMIAQEGWQPMLSPDGARLLFIAPADGIPEAWITPVSGGERRQITRDPAGIAEAVLSGDGNVLWATTLAGRILRVELNTQRVQEIVPQTSVILVNPFGFPEPVAAGGIGRIAGTGLTSSYSTSGVQVLADGQPLPLLSAGPEEIRFQIPWEFTGRRTLTLAQTSSPFEDVRSLPVNVETAFPQFLYTKEGWPLIVHEDFRGIVGDNDPARPGEILHLYMTGLGPVSPGVLTGEPAPVSPLSRVTGQIFASWQGSLSTNMPRPEILFAGLAPGTTGAYQVDVRVPDVSPFTLGIAIQAGNAGAAANFPVR